MASFSISSSNDLNHPDLLASNCIPYNSCSTALVNSYSPYAFNSLSSRPGYDNKDNDHHHHHDKSDILQWQSPLKPCSAGSTLSSSDAKFDPNQISFYCTPANPNANQFSPQYSSSVESSSSPTPGPGQTSSSLSNIYCHHQIQNPFYIVDNCELGAHPEHSRNSFVGGHIGGNNPWSAESAVSYGRIKRDATSITDLDSCGIRKPTISFPGLCTAQADDFLPTSPPPMENIVARRTSTNLYPKTMNINVSMNMAMRSPPSFHHPSPVALNSLACSPAARMHAHSSAISPGSESVQRQLLPCNQFQWTPSTPSPAPIYTSANLASPSSYNVSANYILSPPPTTMSTQNKEILFQPDDPLLEPYYYHSIPSPPLSAGTLPPPSIKLTPSHSFYAPRLRTKHPRSRLHHADCDDNPLEDPKCLGANIRTNLCGICGKSYARPSTLKTHLRTHSGEKPYHCEDCHKCFSQAANLTAHVRIHSGEKPFHCPICGRRFSQSSSVTTHMRTHSGERPYRCRLCRKAFSDSSTLTKHLRIHSGEKPYQCKLCQLRFSQSGNLNRHMKVHNLTAATGAMGGVNGGAGVTSFDPVNSANILFYSQ